MATVLLSYQDPEEVLKNKIEREKRKVASGNVTEKDEKEDPITPYIDKLFKFKESEATCDLFFLCNDGEVGAHRLVIGNASNYIATMQDGQSPWFPVYISVPDLSMELVQCLVKLAYTGQMILPPTYTSEDLIDAMQALGWVQSDHLTASYTTDSSNPILEDDVVEGGAGATTSKPTETVLKTSFPKNKKGETEASDEDEFMEMDLPEVPVSDEDDKSPTTKPKKPLRNSPKVRGGRQNKKQNKPKVILPRESKPSPTKAKRQRSSSPTESLEESAQSDPVTKMESRKRGSKTTNGNDNENEEDISPIPVVASPEAVRSRTRTIRKPKKFDDLIVLTPTKRKESPIKSPTKAVVKTAKDSEEEKNPKGTPKKGTKPTIVPTAASSTNKKPRRSTSIASDSNDKNSLITSYFSKRSPRKSDDHSALANTNESVNDCDNDSIDTPHTQNHVTGSSKNERTDSKDEKEDDILEGDPNKLTLRKRAKSTTSTKSDKDTTKEKPQPQDEGPSVRRKRNVQDGKPAEEPAHPSRRMRKSSTVSNSSNKGT